MKLKFIWPILLVSSFIVTSCDKGGDNDGIVEIDGPSINIHYSRPDNDYSKWALWLWDFPSGQGDEYDFNGSDDYGAVASYALSTWGDSMKSLGFIVKSKGSWDKKDPDGDRSINFEDLTMDENEAYHIYLKSGDETVYLTPEGKVQVKVLSAEFITDKRISVHANAPIKSYEIYEDDEMIGSKTLPDEESDSFVYELPQDKVASFESTYKVKVTFFIDNTVVEYPVNISSLFKTNDFDTKYTYEGNDLGATYTKEKTTFKVWSPISKTIKLRIYNTGNENGGDSNYKEHAMTLGERGVWSTEIEGDLAGKYYTYVVTNNTYTDKEIVDPYAKSAGLDGVRGMIVDFAQTNPEGWDEVSPIPYDRTSLTVYETHVSDVTSSATWGGSKANAKIFKGMYEEGTTYTEGDITVKTGFDHIKELGVNAVQLIPIFDQANDELLMSEFNWGYNPLNYNVLEGKYSSDPTDGYVRIKEFKELVMAYHEAGINIIMDVVYNHVNSALGSNFDVLMPGYYYRYNADGALSNGSGCGNETASEMPMMRKFMIDSTKFWMSEYKLGGFRFDLMGLHDLYAMEKVSEGIKEVFPEAYICGEPWSGGTSPLSDNIAAKTANGNKFKGYGLFNDQMRDALIKGGLSGKSELGWITSATDAINPQDEKRLTDGIKGRTYLSMASSVRDPETVTNYVTCHDNYTLFDRITAAGATTDQEVIKKQAMLANSIVLTSQATSFILAGEEFLRTKGGDENSYASSYKVNELDYALKVDHLDMFKNYQKLIELKQSFGGLHLDKDAVKDLDVKLNDVKSVLSYEFTDGSDTYLFIHANGLTSSETVDLSGYGVIYLDTLGLNPALTNSVSLKPYQTLIVKK